MIRADVLYIGYPRSGSTYLRAYFRDHPGINYDDQQIAEILYQPNYKPELIEKPKGKVYISCDESIAESVCITGDPTRWGKYLYRPGCFNLVRHDLIINAELAAWRMKQAHPRAKILMVIREQIDWFSSIYKATVTSLPPGQRTFHDWWITPQGIACRFAGHHDVIIDAWASTYDDVLVLRYENLMSSSVMLCDWLGVGWVPFPPRRVNESHATVSRLHRHLPFMSGLPHGVKSALKPLARFIPGKRSAVLSPDEQQMIRDQYEESNVRTRRYLSASADHPPLHDCTQFV